MERWHMAILLGLAVALSGCTTIPGQKKEEKPEVVRVTGPTCTVGGQPCSSVTLTKYDDPVRISMGIKNNGEEPLKVFLDSKNTAEDGRLGRRILVGKCNDDILRIEAYRVRKESTRGSSTFTSSSADQYPAPPAVTTVRGNSRLNVIWKFEIPNDLSVSTLGYRCPLSFDLQFQQILKAGRQIQLKAARNVPEVGSLDRTFSSRFPVKLVIDAPRSVVVGEGRKLSVSGYIRNVGPGKVKNVRKLAPESGSWLDRKTGTGGGEGECTPADVRMYRSGKRSGESYRKSCTVPLPSSLGSSSQIKWLRYNSSYTYEMPLTPSKINLEIKPVPGG